MNFKPIRILGSFIILIISATVLYGQATTPAPYGPLPTKAQLKWHQTEMYAMVCFGLNTYTDKEWGYGDVDPSLFNPTAFDAEQITGTLKEAGFKAVLLVAKHHDGFCLWPTKSTNYSVAASPWMGGKGDMVKSFETATRKSGLRFGVYNSPWDRNNATYGTPAYLSVYRQQLKELSTNYGPLFISWYDGANGGDGYYGGAKDTREIDRATYYDWDKTWQITRTLQPEAVIFSDIGPDVRWVGNERGFAAETSWATFTPKGEKDINKPALGDSRYAEAPGGNRDGKFWIPAECDVPLRQGWYYHASQDNTVKSPYELFDIYFKSVGRGAALDLGIAPDKRGILHENDVAALKGFGKLLKQTFSQNLLEKAQIKASNIRSGNLVKYGPKNMLDDNINTYWASDDKITTPEFTVKLAKKERFNIIRLREYIALGQRIEAFAVDIWKNNTWQEITQGTSIGAQRLIRLPYFITTDQIRVRVLKSPVCPLISEFSVFAEPEATLSPIVKTNTDILSLNKQDWKILSVPGTKDKAPALLDNKSTIWEGPFNSKKTSDNAIVIDMGKLQEISGIIFTPSPEPLAKGIMDKYQIFLSTDGVKWGKETSGELGNIRANPLKQLIALPEKTTARYIKFVPIHLAEQHNFIRIMEIGAY
ncbi:alpha-L-fucosidase [Pedobacter frigoris]|uniref:alpha-L-fucosidase n=1 Tax=Pedobacter frigoris TaxID=2571272 RepID=UPI00292DFBE4|nr:alpha-L-fucosidase [Pedobacter frigoris]